jgi:hypothetical protein
LSSIGFSDKKIANDLINAMTNVTCFQEQYHYSFGAVFCYPKVGLIDIDQATEKWVKDAQPPPYRTDRTLPRRGF